MVTAVADVVACAVCGRRNRVPATASGRPRCASCHADLPWLVTADDSSFDAAVVRSPMPVLVDVWAPWCGPCRAVAPVVESLASELAGRVKVVEVNSDESPGVAGRHDVTSIPTFLVYRNGAEVARNVGAPPAARLREWVRTAIAQ